MKRIVLIAFIFNLPVSAFAGSEVWSFFQTVESWSFVQSVGGLIVESPTLGPKGWVLPVRANVSGLEAFSTKPTTLNSARICEGINATIEGSNIQIAIVTSLTRKNTSARCPAALLGTMSPGKYKVFYRGPDESPVPLGEVTIGL